MKRAVVVFSGGQDSTTCLVQALQQYDEVHCVTFDYGQRHRAEIDVARELALKLGARAHKVLDVTLLNELAVSSLTRDSIPVPDYEPEKRPDIVVDENVKIWGYVGYFCEWLIGGIVRFFKKTFSKKEK